jgi:hypothetical protein
MASAALICKQVLVSKCDSGLFSVTNEILYCKTFVKLFKALCMKLTNEIKGIFIQINNGLQIKIMKIYDKESGIKL